MALFSKRHYEFLAKFSASCLNDQQIGRLASYLEFDNRLFNYQKFTTDIRNIRIAIRKQLPIEEVERGQ